MNPSFAIKSTNSKKMTMPMKSPMMKSGKAPMPPAGLAQTLEKLAGK